MLALDRQFGAIADLALFGDHADPRRIYWLPVRPRLVDMDGLAELSFVKYRGRSGDGTLGPAGGLLSFTTELAARAEAFDEARRELVRLGVEEPVFVPLPVRRGKAVLATALTGEHGLAEEVVGEVVPDLIGGQRATFALAIPDAERAALIERMLTMTGPSPIGVRYELEFLGLRPALHARLRADYRRIYDELSVGFQAGVAYQGVGVRVGVESATQKLVEHGAIEIDVQHFTDDADLRARTDEVIRWFQQHVIEEFFDNRLDTQPSPQQLLREVLAAAAQLGVQSLQELLANSQVILQIAQLLGISPETIQQLGGGAAAGGGNAAQGGSSSSFALKLQFSLRKIHTEQLSVVELDWNEARAEARTAAPQGLLAQLGGAASVREVEGSDEFFTRLRAVVRPLGNLPELGVERLVVHAAWPDEVAPRELAALVFDPDDLEPKIFGAWIGEGPQTYRTRAEAHFRDDGPWPGRSPISSGPWRTQLGRELAIHPLADVARVELELSATNLDFDAVPQVLVEIRVDDVVRDTIALERARPVERFRWRSDGEAPPRVEVRPRWLLATGNRVEGAWQEAAGATVFIPGPWRSTRAVRLVPALPSDFIEAFVRVSLEDGGGTRSLEVPFAPGERKARVATLPSIDELAPPLVVEPVVVRGDGTVFVGAARQVTEPVMIVRDRDGEHRVLTVRLLAGAKLADHGVMAVRVQLLGEDDGELDAITFTESRRDPAILLVPLERGAGSARIRVTRYALDATPRVGPIEESNATELLVPAIAPA